MRWIEKQVEPPTVEETRCASTTDLSRPAGARVAFDQLDKQAVRSRLATEQGWLCAFCMRRIDESATDERGEHRMKIAHRMPVAVAPGLALTWRNLLGSCDGGQRSGGRYRTCDLSQEATPLTVDPTVQSSVARLTYEWRGGQPGLFITSDDPAIRRDLDETLRVNSPDLRTLRQKAWEAFRKLERREHPRGPYGKDARRDFFQKWRPQPGSRLPEMQGVIEAMTR